MRFYLHYAYKKIGKIFVETHDKKIHELREKTNYIKRLIKTKNIKNISLDWI